MSAKEYHRCFEAFKPRSSEWEAMLDWCRERLDVWNPEQSDFRAVSVGPGSGDFDWDVLPLLASRWPGMEYVLVEPSPAMCRALRKRIAEQPVPDVNISLDPVSFDASIGNRPFDLIMFTHCLYYMPNRGTALKRAESLVTERGVVTIFHQTDKGINQLHRRFLETVKGEVKEMLSSVDVARLLDEQKIPYRLRELESYIDVTDCFDPDSPDGLDLLSFFLESDFRSLDYEMQANVVDYLDNLAKEVDGR